MARKQQSFSEQLREAIRKDERSRYRISLNTGIPQGQLSRFMNEKGGLSIRSINRLFGTLQLQIDVTHRVSNSKDN